MKNEGAGTSLQNRSRAKPAAKSKPAAITVQKPLHIIGLGGAGCNMLEYFYQKELNASYTCINNTSRPAAKTPIRFIEFYPPATNGDAQRFSASSLNTDLPPALPANIKRLFKKDAYYLLLAGIGGYTGSLVLQQVTALLAKRKIAYNAICCLPYGFESPTRTVVATQTLEALKNDIHIQYFDLQSTRGKFPGLTMNKVFEQVHARVFAMFETMMAARQKAS